MPDEINYFREAIENLKGGNNKMETKSRYEIIADLEERKSELMSQEANLGLTEAKLNRRIEEAQEDLKDFEEGKDIAKQNFKDQIESIEKSLERLSTKK